MAEDQSSRRMWLWAPLTGLLTAGIALAALLLWPEGSADPSSRLREYGPRPDGRPPPAVVVNCLRQGGTGPLPQADGTCRPGDLISLKTTPRPGERFLSAASLGPDGAVRWYFPAAGVPSLPLGSAGLASRGARVGEDHPAGRYRLFVLLSEGPLDPPQAQAALDALRAGRTPLPRVLEASFDVVR